MYGIQRRYNFVVYCTVVRIYVLQSVYVCGFSMTYHRREVNMVAELFWFGRVSRIKIE